MNPGTSRPIRRGFTLTELLTLVGLVTVLMSLLVPVLSKVRAAANNATCLSTIHQMGAAWTTYAMEHRGHFPEYVWYTPPTPDIAWNGYWLGALDKNGVRGDSLLCPAARDEGPEQGRGFGNVNHAWTGRYATNGSVVRRGENSFRVSSYGYNRYLTGGNSGTTGSASRLSALPNWCNTPVFVDCAYADAVPANGAPQAPVAAPPDLTGARLDETSPEHWRFLLGRHGRGVNVFMADGSAKWVRLDDLYQLSWSTQWRPYRLSLPSK